MAPAAVATAVRVSSGRVIAYPSEWDEPNPAARPAAHARRVDFSDWLAGHHELRDLRDLGR